ncbi:hypothetical protein OG874_21600 [Nocardia sp. NBC_00565]|uniref:hypothetical protein n=1 Tax=Nocardia sp. NBC_00565 TaxID=2975993 RepID=UPI002E818EBB|nr:hypothetical protein [Nocardia sp. NBC_00565]WUC07521.1 hypothetical protein OG874_21600 [Nocardia sp. NBC_00565]
MDDTTPSQGWYRGFRHWETDFSDPVRPLLSLNWLAAEMVGAGVVASDSLEAEWMGGRSSWDFHGDGVYGDAKLAWHHTDGVLGIPNPPRKTGLFDPDKVDEVVLVVLSNTSVEHHEYLPDGSVTFTMKAKPECVFRVPVETMNRVMRRDGKSNQRWLVDIKDIEAFRVRPFPGAQAARTRHSADPAPQLLRSATTVSPKVLS